MSYAYKTQKSVIFTEEGQRTFLRIRDNVQRLVKQSGAVRLQEAISGCTGDVWDLLACVDRLVEIGELREITQGNVAGQHRVFVSIR